jgi:hypothetical protein
MPQRNPEAREVEEGPIGGEQMLMAHQQAAKLTQPGVGSLHDPAPFIASHFPSILVLSRFPILPIGRDQLDPASPQSFAQRIGIVGAVGDHPFRFLPRPACRAGDADCGERGFRKPNFMRRGTFEPNSQRKTLTVDQYHPLCSLAALGFTDGGAPFFAGAKLPSRKVSSHFSNPSSSSAPNRARHASSQTSSSSHCFSLRQQVEGEGYSSGRKRQAAPVCKIQRMPSKQARLEAHGRPRLSSRRRGGGNNGSINCHCSSVNSFCRFFMTEAHQLTCLHVSTSCEAEPIYETRSSQGLIARDGTNPGLA